MGSAEEERGMAGSEAFTDSADGSSSSSDAASTDEWPVLAPALKKTSCCVSDTELGKQHKQKRRAASGNGTS